MDKQEALDEIIELARPGQELSLSEAIDILCDIWNIAKSAKLAAIEKQVAEIYS